MSALPSPRSARPVGRRVLRALLLAVLVIVGLACGVVAGLFIADSLGWLPRFAVC